MKHIILLPLIALVSMLMNPMQLSSQVTIGTNEKPQTGALLELKNIPNITDGSANATKGLGMPRANLTSLNSLDDIDPTNAIRPDKNKHIGLMVYNINACAK